MPAILAGCTWTSPRTGRVVNPGHKACTTIMQYKGIKEHPTRWEDWHDLVKVQPHRTRLANRKKKKKRGSDPLWTCGEGVGPTRCRDVWDGRGGEVAFRGGPVNAPASLYI